MRKLRLALLVAALGLLAFTTYQPHWRADEGFGRDPYPVHLDEYVHWGFAREIQRTGIVEAGEPFGGEAPSQPAGALDPRYPAQIHERGFQAYLAALQSVTGIEWILLIELAPVAVAMLLGLCVFLLAERWNAGVEAVLWLAAIPTTLRFLGPGFLVPVAFSMPLVVLGFHMLANHDGPRAWLGSVVILAALWPIHALGALALTALALVHIALRARSAPQVAVAAALVAVPLIAAWPYYARYLEGSILVDTGLPSSVESIRLIGPWPFLLAAIGAAWLVTREDDRARAAGGALAALFLVAGAIVVLRSTNGWDPFKLYDRTVTVLLLLAAVLGGAGVRAVYEGAKWVLARMQRPRLAPAALAAILAVQGVAVAAAVDENADQLYYRMLNDARYENMTAAADLLGPHHRRAIVDGLHTMAWTDITGIPTLYVQFPSSGGPPEHMTAFLEDGSRDTAYLIHHGVSVVVTHRTVENPDLHELVPGVYVLDEPLAARIAASARV